MNFNYVYLRNWGPFEKRKFNFDTGLIGIVGPNGTGKSTVIETLYSALTGQFRKYPDMADFIRDLPNGEKSPSGFCEVQFTHDDVIITVRRSVSVSKRTDKHIRVVANSSDGTNEFVNRCLYKGSQTAKLTIATVSDPDKSETITGVKLVDAELRKLLGDSIAILGQYAFIEQNDISGIVDTDASTRTKAIHRLFGLEHFEKIWSLLGDEIRNLPELHPVDDDLDKLLAEKNHLTVQRSQTLNIKRQLEDELIKLNIDKIQADIDLWETAQGLRDKITSAEERVKSARLHSADCESARTKALNEVNNISNDFNNLKPRFEAAQKFLDSAIAAVVALKRKNELLDSAKSIAERVRSLKAPSAPDEVWSADAEVELNDKHAILQLSKTFVAKHSGLMSGENTMATCPTCGQTIDNISAAITEHQRKISELQPIVTELESKKFFITDKQHRYLEDQCAHKATLAALQHSADDIQRAFSEVVSKCPKNPEEYSEIEQARQRIIVAEYNTLHGSLKSVTNFLNCADNNCVKAKLLLEEAEQQYRSIRDNLSSLGSNAAGLNYEYIEQCRSQIKNASNCKMNLVRVEENIRGLDERMVQIDLRVERAEALQLRINKINLVRQTLNDARGVFHRSSLPSILGRKFLGAIDTQLQLFLSLMQSNFTSTLECSGEDYIFRCIFADASEREASKLSGGERVKFAVSFLLAVNEVLASRLGVLALDEPTAQLDDDNVNYFAAVLSYVRQYANNTGMQIFLITHSQQLQGAFDQTIDLCK